MSVKTSARQGPRGNVTPRTSHLALRTLETFSWAIVESSEVFSWRGSLVGRGFYRWGVGLRVVCAAEERAARHGLSAIASHAALIKQLPATETVAGGEFYPIVNIPILTLFSQLVTIFPVA